MIELDVIDPETDDREPPKYRFWRDAADRDGDDASPADRLNEFEKGDSTPPDGASRRQFLQLMGAAMAMAGLTGCRRPVEKILPYSRKPEEVIPGVPQSYATAMPFRGVLRPVLVESHEGRPTKVKPNRDHPSGLTGTSAYEQASILNLYDPDRSRTVRRDGSEASWADFVSFCRSLAEGGDQKTVAVLVEETSSPTMQAMRRRLEGRFGNVEWIPYRSDGDDTVALGMQQAYGRRLRPQYDFDEAERILSLDADFLSGADPDFTHNQRTFSEGRKLDGPEDDMSRLYSVESQFSETGGMADNRLRMKAGRIGAFAAAIAEEMGAASAPDVEWSEKERLWIREVARDLEDGGARSVVLAGESQPPEVHALAMAINQRLGSVGTTVRLYDTGREPAPRQDEALADLAASMRGGEVDALFMVGVNPVYDAPAGVDFEGALDQVSETVHVGLWRDETARRSRWHVPRAHYLEAWGDGRAYDGTLSVVQPLIEPLYDDAHSGIEVLNAVATGIDAAGYDLVRDEWRGRVGGAFESTWRKALHDGYLPDSRFDTVEPARAAMPAVEAPDEEGLEMVFRLDPTLLDGRFSNNAWMQELPNPVNKIVWDNVAVMSQATADELGLGRVREEGNYHVDRAEFTVNGETVELPIWIQPGHPDGSITVTMGYGHTIATTRGSRNTPFWDTDDQTDIYNNAPIAGGLDDAGDPVDVVGANVAPLRSTGSRVATGASATKVGSGYLIASTQEEGSMHGRPIVRWATLDEFKENPDFVADADPPVPSLGGHGGGGHGGGHGGGGHGGDGAAGAAAGAAADSAHADSAHADSAHADSAHADSARADSARGDGRAGKDPSLPEASGAHDASDADAPSFQDYPTMWQDNHPKDQAAYRDNPYYQNQWGMSIDLNACSGCNACIVACTSENNVQVVGKDEVSRGRHMYWLRTDRYYVSTDGNEDEPEMMTQPVMCQHCENAPCESVCPVAATVHSPDGTNQMIYNRCIGTRYCSNNCPYKVRRFNFYNWTKTLPAEVQMAQNPNVSVRSRGVMEKCSWCIHRVRDAQSQADNEGRDLRPDEIETACQEACPADAITFGDTNNPDSSVVEQKNNPRRYELLGYLNVKPRLSYLGRVRNPNPRLQPERVADDAGAAGEPAEASA
jgi:molybdopterin-containing oxidoreductase family iron-sulfur binding subunit